MSGDWFYRDAPKAVLDAERVAELENDLAILCEHLGVDLGTLRTVTAPAFRTGHACDWYSTEARRDLDALEDCLDRGEPFPPAVDARGRTLRRWLTADRSRRVVTG